LDYTSDAGRVSKRLSAASICTAGVAAKPPTAPDVAATHGPRK